MEKGDLPVKIDMAIKPKLIPKNILAQDEQVFFESHQSRWIFMKSAILAIIIAAVAIVLLIWTLYPERLEIPFLSSSLNGGNVILIQLVLLAIIIIGFLYYFVRWLRWRSTVYAITNQRLITRKGIASETYRYIPVTQIEDIKIQISLLGKLLKYGRIIISTEPIRDNKPAQEKGKEEVDWTAVPDPYSVMRKLQEVKYNRRS